MCPVSLLHSLTVLDPLHTLDCMHSLSQSLYGAIFYELLQEANLLITHALVISLSVHLGTIWWETV